MSQVERPVKVVGPDVVLDADLAIPEAPRGLVVFAHGTGSGRHSPRNRAVARTLQLERFSTLLLDLLTLDEERVDLSTRQLRFDIGLLAQRLVAALAWCRNQPETADLRAGLFGASTGGGAALVAAAQRPDLVHAVVSRGGRPDLAEDALPAVRAPVLLIVGGADTTVLKLNREAAARLTTPHELAVVPGATHLFEEPGALEQVSGLAAAHFRRYLASASQ